MKSLCILLLLAVGINSSCNIGTQTDPLGSVTPQDPSNYHELCATSIRSQIKIEFEAALQYLVMGAYFDRDSFNLKGIAKLFWSHADEEREHGLRFIKYLRMRGDAETDFIRGEILPILGKYEWSNALEALRDALTMEKKVSASIKKIIDTCSVESKEDYLSGDWLTSTWLDDQMNGQRKLAGLINTLSNFRRDHESLGDWMFSNSLLAIE